MAQQNSHKSGSVGVIVLSLQVFKSIQIEKENWFILLVNSADLSFMIKLPKGSCQFSIMTFYFMVLEVFFRKYDLHKLLLRE